MEEGGFLVQRQFLAIDLKSFYASTECREQNLDPLTTNWEFPYRTSRRPGVRTGEGADRAAEKPGCVPDPGGRTLHNRW